jgi:hypothetical protein
MCDCNYPMSTVVFDEIVSRKPKKNGMVTVNRYSDCMMCGPFVDRIETVPKYVEGELVRRIGVEPYRYVKTRVEKNQ